MSFFRYPGGKAKLLPHIRKYLDEWIGLGVGVEYREPFVGAGSVATDVLERYPHLGTIWVNDKDAALACLWMALSRKEMRDALKDMVNQFTPSVREFFAIKEFLTSGAVAGTTQMGFYKLAIHQMSYSGLGVKSAGPLGGKGQASPYKIDCRWNPVYINKRIDQIGARLDSRRVDATGIDFEDLLLGGTIYDTVVLYIDPPYYDKGAELYQHAFTADDHVRLADTLKSCPYRWLLSYDAAPEILELYQGWTRIETVDVAYSITNSRKKPELLICRI